MQQNPEVSGDTREELAKEVNESLGNPDLTAQSAQDNPNEPEHDELPEYAKKKLGIQEKRHKKEMRRMQESFQSQLDELNSRLQQPSNHMNSFESNHDQGGELDHKLYSLVQKVMNQEKEQQRKQQQEQMAQHVYKKQSELINSLDKHSDKYDDFDEVVRDKNSPYTESMTAVAMLLHDIPGVDVPEVLYRLGKDKNKLHEISKLHPLDQGKEVLKLAIAMMNNGGGKSPKASEPLGNIKNNPVTSSNVNSQTSVSDLRRRMKQNLNKWGS